MYKAAFLVGTHVWVEAWDRVFEHERDVSNKGSIRGTDRLDELANVEIAELAPFVLPKGAVTLCPPLNDKAILAVQYASACNEQLVVGSPE